MKRIVDIDVEYRRFHGMKAIDHFFKMHPELDYWKEQSDTKNRCNKIFVKYS